MADAGGSLMRGPNLFIIGAPKCGTTALAQYLSEHPGTFFSDPKEPFFFAADYPVIVQQHFLSSLDDYLALFAAATPDHQVIAEASTNYLRSRYAVDAVLKFNPQARFIVMLRNPVEVAQAFHMEQVYVLNEDEPDFGAAWALRAQRAAGQRIPAACRAPQFLQYGELGLFGEQVDALLAKVPRDRVHFIRFEDFKANTARVYADTLCFLGLPDDGRCQFPVINASHRHRSEAVARWVLDPPEWLRAPVWRVRGHFRRKRYRLIERAKAALKAPAPRPSLSPALRAELVDYFRNDIVLLEGLLGWDLSSWRSHGG